MNLIISDFDGTFYDDNYDKNIEFIENIKEKYDFVIATGRHFKSLKRDLKIKCKYYICNDGGYILDDKENFIYKQYMDNDELKTACSRLKELKYEDYFIDHINYFDKKINESASKISIKIRDNKADDDMLYIVRDLKETYGYLSENWINILPMKSRKEEAVEQILNLTNYDKVYVIGNEINDYEMLKKYNGFLITNEVNTEFNTISSFMDLKEIIK